MQDNTFANMDREDWCDAADYVTPFMCPDTGRECHSLCVCCVGERTRGDGALLLKCEKYGVYVPTEL